MLCDDILADTKLKILYPKFGTQQEILQHASKFVLSSDFAAAADGLVNNIDELTRITPFCRLPAPICWIEVAQGDRPHFAESAITYPDWQGVPKRIGFLAYAQDPNKLWNWVTFLMWSMRNPSPLSLGNPNNASMLVVNYDTKNGFPYLADAPGEYSNLTKYIEICVAPYCVDKDLLQTDTPLFRLSQSDWAGEIRYFLAVLGLINAKNVMETQRVDKTEHNRKRRKHGQPPLHSHTLLKIRAMHRRSFLGQRGKGTSEDIRKHFVVGHWKTRRTGLFWWNPHWRGSEQHGSVTHDYEVTT